MRKLLLSAPFLATASVALAHNPAADHAPIGVMGDHLHQQGEIMLSARYMYMQMEGNRIGSDRVTTAEAHREGFAVIPENMPMEMLMVGMMYAPNDQITLAAMLPYISSEMDHHVCMPPASAPACGGANAEFTTAAEGIGDLKLSALIGIHRTERSNAHLTIGINAPTGSVTKRDDTPMGNQLLPFPMQIGSGTWDFRLGMTYNGKIGTLGSWGAQFTGTMRTGENERDYRLGNRAEVTSWIARDMGKQTSASLRINAQHWSDVRGDNIAGPAPTMRADLRAGKRVDLGFGANWVGTEGALEGQRLAIEVMVPAYQHLDGPQLETDYTVTLGWQKAWE